MGLKDTISEDIKTAMRAKDELRRGTLRLLAAAIQRREIDERITLDDEQVLAVIQKLIKQGREAIRQFEAGSRQDLVDKENNEIAIWEAYLPQQLGASELEELVAAAVNETGATSIKDMGRVMGILKPRIQGRADMGQVSALVKARFG